MLMTAALSGKADAVRLLLTRGATVDTKEPYRGQTALMWAAAEGNTAAVDVLLEAGADLKLKSNGGFTPLLFAVRNAHIETTVALLKRGANVNDVAPDGSSALSIASGERLLRAGIGAARSRREPEPARPARVAAPHRGVAAQARRRRRRRRRQHARRARRSRPARSRPSSSHENSSSTAPIPTRASSGTSRASAKRAAPRATRRTSGWGATFSATGARRRSTSPRRTATSS